ncbi:MAG: HAD family hydrolase [Glaciimonas sp.]|nr:HAD family hydrolase [Glaciimonas sp.]
MGKITILKTPIKAVLFDLDDTLWPITPVIEQAEKVLHEWLLKHAPAVAERYSIDLLRSRRQELMHIEPRYQIDLWGLRHKTLSDAFRQVGADVALVDHAMGVFSTARNAVTPFADVLPGLAKLNTRLAVGSISNGFADLQAIGIAHHFQTSIAAHRFGRAKPDPQIFHAACAALDIPPQQAVYVGDDLMLDVQGAQNAGMQGVWMNRFERRLPEQCRPDAVCTTLHELDHWLINAMGA